MKNKLWVCFLIFLLCFCAIFFNYAYDNAKKTAIKDLNEKQMSFAGQASIGIEDFFNQWTNLLISITQMPAIANLDETGRKYISFIYETNKVDITAISRVDANGRVIFTAPFNPKAIGQDISGQKHIQEVMRSHKPAVSDVFKSVQGFDMIALHVPVIKNGKYQGTLAIGINFQNLAKRYLESIRIGKTGYAWMFSRDGTELYCPVSGHTGKSVFENYKDYPDIIAMAEEMIKGKQGITVYSFDQIRDQKFEVIKKHAVYMPIHIGQTLWSIVVESSENEILSSLEQFRNSLILIIGLFFVGGAIFSFFGLRGWFIVHEEQKRKKAEEALRRSEENFRASLNDSPIGIRIVTEEGETLYANRAILDIYGYDSLEELNSIPIERRYPPESQAGFQIRREKRKHGDDVPSEYKVSIIRKDGEVRHLQVLRKEILWDGEKQFQVIYQDITDRKRAEDALKEEAIRRRILIEQSSDGIVVLDQNGKVFEANQRYADLLGYSMQEVLQLHVWDWDTRWTRVQLMGMLQTINETGDHFETRHRRKDGTFYDVEISTNGAMCGGQKLVFCVCRDITDRKRAEEKILASLREKDILISEIHHRVKNNLQVMSGLLNLQARASKNLEVIESFNESQDRIRAMALVHEKLYNSKDFSKIDLAGYIRSLSQELFISYNIRPGKIDLTIEIKEGIILDVKRAIPCGLVMNELISNALKHAFPGDGQGKLQIIIRETESKEIEIIVRDNGVSLPNDVGIDEPGSVGLHLVKGLVKNQINGQIEVRRDKGTEFRITFHL